MNIMGKDIIQKWVKNKWLIFEETPDIYQIYQVHYEDKDAWKILSIKAHRFDYRAFF